RTGVLVADGVVYAVAGIWNTEGIYVHALNALDGTVLWCNDSGGFVQKSVGGQYRPADPHSGEFHAVGINPQGALLATSDTLVVPQANNGRVTFDRKTGSMKPYAANS